MPAPIQLTLAYALLAGGWVVVSDAIVAVRGHETLRALALNMGKGGLFVIITSLVLYRLARSMEARVRAAERERHHVALEGARSVQRANRIYAALARANEIALTAREREPLCRAIGETLIGSGGLRLAWICWVDEGTQQVVTEVAVGLAAGYVDGIVVSVDPARPEAHGPVGRALRAGTSFVCQDIEFDPAMTPWRARAREHRLGAIMAVPLRLGDGARGALAIYAEESGFFTREVALLVEQLATDLAHGLDVIAVRQRSERQAAALVESEQRWQFALEGAGDGVWDWNVATGDAFFSPQLARMFGYAPEEFRGRYEEWQQHVHPDDLPRTRARLVDCLCGRTAVLHAEHRVRCRDGSYRWVLSRGKVVERTPEGEARRMIGTFADLTEVRRASQRLTLLETALQAMPSGIVITDEQGRVEWVNEHFTRLTGYAADEVIGGNPRLLKSGRHGDDFYAQMWNTIRSGKVWSGELVNRRKDGTEYNEHMIIAPVSHGGEGITHFIAIKQDVTERKVMEQQLLRAQRMEGIGLLAGGIAHDLNNVLAPILLSTELLRLRIHDAADRRVLEVIESAARRGSGVVRQVLTFARGIDGERSPVRPRDLLREVALIIQETFPRDIEVHREVAEDLPMVRGDATQLHQVLLNLAVNARDAMPQGGTLTLRARAEQVATRRNGFTGELPPGAYVVLSVRDTGQGMTPAVRERIFEPFFTTKPRGKGTGLGLPTVLGIVRSHGGIVEVDSTPGGGSEFRVYLPAIAPEKVDSAAPIPLATVAGRGRLVLVCDDEPSVREVASSVLRHAGFEVVEAGNGREALVIFSERRGAIALVLMDIMMPLLTGDRAAADIRRQEPGLPVIFMSGLMDLDAVQAATKDTDGQAPALLKKPFAAGDLLAAVARAVGV
ncbi:MAG: PAS domain S-box protein [Opitutae bacterium]|nr:PAS domain S-box protein [Opitutae bacterium]